MPGYPIVDWQPHNDVSNIEDFRFKSKRQHRTRQPLFIEFAVGPIKRQSRTRDAPHPAKRPLTAQLGTLGIISCEKEIAEGEIGFL